MKCRREMLAWQTIGEAWEKQARAKPPRDSLRGRIDDPLGPVNAALLPDADGVTAQLVWSRGD